VAASASLDLDELVDHWTVLDDERALVDAKHGATRLGFALLLKFYTRHGRFPSGVSELPDGVVEFVARQLRAAPSDLASYEWTGRAGGALLALVDPARGRIGVLRSGLRTNVCEPIAVTTNL
jgi:hypothetical protein